MIRLTKESNNLHKLYIGHKIQSIIWFSYETPIAYVPDNDIPGVIYIAKNQWSSTTGKHLNIIDPDKSKRIPYNELLEILKAVKTG